MSVNGVTSCRLSKQLKNQFQIYPKLSLANKSSTLHFLKYHKCIQRITCIQNVAFRLTFLAFPVNILDSMIDFAQDRPSLNKLRDKKRGLKNLDLSKKPRTRSCFPLTKYVKFGCRKRQRISRMCTIFLDMHKS